MLQLTPHLRLLVCVEPIDFRKGINGLVRICRALAAHELHVLLSAGDPRGVNAPADWRPLAAAK